MGRMISLVWRSDILAGFHDILLKNLHLIDVLPHSGGIKSSELRNPSYGSDQIVHSVQVVPNPAG